MPSLPGPYCILCCPYLVLILSLLYPYLGPSYAFSPYPCPTLTLPLSLPYLHPIITYDDPTLIQSLSYGYLYLILAYPYPFIIPSRPHHQPILKRPLHDHYLRLPHRYPIVDLLLQDPYPILAYSGHTLTLTLSLPMLTQGLLLPLGEISIRTATQDETVSTSISAKWHEG